MVPFAGWEMPVQYTGIKDEHRAVRRSAGLFDVSHMGEILITGPEAQKFLNFIVTNDLEKISVGQAQYNLLCNPDGGCIDDLIIYRTQEDQYMVVANAANVEMDYAWILQYAGDFDCDALNLSAQYALLALQGPKSESILASLVPGTSKLSRFRSAEYNLGDAEVYIGRTGYTGEDGFEVYCQSNDTEEVANMLWDAGQKHALHLTGLGARDSLRLEAGLPLYGHELSLEISPLQAGLGWAVKPDKSGGFIGRDSLILEKSGGIQSKIKYFVLEGRRIAREGTAVKNSAGKEVGKVVSGTFSPILEQPIGSALLATSAIKEQELWVDLRGNKSRLQIKKPPLHA